MSPPEAPLRLAPPRSAWWVAAGLTVVGFPVDSLVGNAVSPRAGLDPSWVTGLALAHQHGIHHGTELAFTYGPLGFLSAPLDVSRSQLLLAMVVAVATAFALHLAVQTWLRRWCSTAAAVGVGLVVAFVAPMMPVAEMGGLALALWVLWSLQGASDGLETAEWALAAMGSAAAFLVLVKFSLVVLVVVVGAAAIVGERRARRVLVTASAVAGSLALMWLAAGQVPGALVPWLRRSVDIAAGYGDAMSIGTFGLSNVGVAIVVEAVALALGIALVRRGTGWRGLVQASALALTSWLFLKGSLVRFDAVHVRAFVVAGAVLAVTVPWPRWRTATVVAVLAVAIVGLGPRTVADGHVDALGSGVEAARQVVDGHRLDARMAAATRRVRGRLQIAPDVIDALRGRRVHADPWYIDAVQAYDLDWRPMLVFQSYSAYSSALDEASARSLTAASGPDAILRRIHGNPWDVAIDGRNPRWEPPGTQVRIECSYRSVAESGDWQALHRTTDRCGARVPLRTARIDPGERVAVPHPTRPGDIVVARFRLPDPGLADALTSALLKPPDPPVVMLDRRRFSFVVGTAGDDHLLRTPARIGGAPSASGASDVESLGFDGVDGPVAVEFLEIRVTR